MTALAHVETSRQNGASHRPPGLAPEVLRLLSEVDVLWRVHDVTAELACATPDPVEAMRLRAYASQARRGAKARVAELDQLGIASVGRERRTIRTGTKSFVLPDRAPEAIRSLVHAVTTSVTPTKEELPMNQLTTDPNPSLNGITPPEEPSLYTRVTQSLRWPTFTEAAVTAAVVLVVSGIYFAATGETPDLDTIA